MKTIIVALCALLLCLPGMASSDHIRIAVEATSFASYEFVKQKDNICDELANQVTAVGEGKYSSNCSHPQENGGDLASVNIKVFHDRAQMTITMENGPELMKGMVFKWKVPVDQMLWRKMISRFMEYIEQKNIEGLQRYALNIGLKESTSVGKGKEGFFHKSTNDVLSEKEALNHFVKEDFINKDGVKIKRNRHLVRAILEIGGIMLTGGTIYQFLDFDVDSDFEYNLEGLKGKFTKGIRFDDNEAMYNLYAHPIAGTMYYTVGRANGLTSFESMVLAFAGSALWEFIPEFAEVASINDQFQTAFTGPAIGEAMFQLGEFFKSGSNTIMHKILGSILGPGTHDWINGHNVARAQNLDHYGFDVRYWHRFNIYAETSTNMKKDGMGYRLGFDMQLNTVPGSQSVGKESGWKNDTLFVELAASLGLKDNEKAEFVLYAKSVYAGLAAKNIFTDSKLRKNGYSIILGPSSSYSLRDGYTGGKRDIIGLVNFLGSTLDMSFFIKDVKIRVCLDVFASFTSVRSFAMEKYKGSVPDSVVKSTLITQNYSNGIGLVSQGKFEVEYKKLGLYVNGQQVMTQSWNGLERNQATITDDLKLRDQRLSLDGNLSYTLRKNGGLQLGVGLHFNQGKSTIKSQLPGAQDFTEGRSEHIWYLRLGGKF